MAFTIKDLGELNYFLGVKITRNVAGTFISQKKYIKDILIDTGMEDCSSVVAPLSTSLKLSIYTREILTEPDVYRRLVRRLLYLDITRPDLSYAVQHLSQFMHEPRTPHLRAALHLARYLKGTMDCGLHYIKNTNFDVCAYSYSDWIGCQFNSRSLSAYDVFIGSNFISWKTKKQATVILNHQQRQITRVCPTLIVIWFGFMVFLKIYKFMLSCLLC